PRKWPQLRLDDRAEEHRYAQGPGLRLRRHVLRRPDLEARELNISPRDLRPCGSPQGLLYVSLENALARRAELNLAVVQEACLGEEAQIQRVGQSDILQIGAWFLQRIVRAIDLGNKDEDQ